MRRLRIALLRGAYFGPFEAQNYEPLLDDFELRAYVLPQNRFDLGAARVPVTVCRYPDARLLGGRSLVNAWRSRVLGQHYPMPGVERIVRSSDLVHTFEGWYTYTRQAARASLRANVPLVITHWDTLPLGGTTPAGEREEILEAYRAAALVLATSTAARESLRQAGVAEGKVVLQAMGVDTDRFSPGPRDPVLMKELGIGPGEVVFLFVGRLAPDKGLRDLVAAFRALLSGSQGPPARLLLVGCGPEQAWIESTAAEWGIGDRVVIHPRVPYGEIERWHRLADVFVFPSRPSGGVQEQFGYALAEAMSCGAAVIATTTGGLPDVVGDAGRLVSAGDRAALAEEMRLLAADHRERERLGGLARRRAAERFSVRVVSRNLAHIYRELCSC